MSSVLKKSIVLILIGSSLILCGFPAVLADYTYVDLAYLASHLPDYLGMSVNTTGRARHDIVKLPEQIGQVFIEDLDSPYVGVWLSIPAGLETSQGSLINVSGFVLYEPMWECYYFEVEYWGPAIEWNPADVNFDLKVDILDVVLCASAYGSVPSAPNWNPYCDIAELYGKIDILDIVTCTIHYGEAYA